MVPPIVDSFVASGVSFTRGACCRNWVRARFPEFVRWKKMERGRGTFRSKCPKVMASSKRDWAAKYTAISDPRKVSNLIRRRGKKGLKVKVAAKKSAGEKHMSGKLWRRTVYRDLVLSTWRLEATRHESPIFWRGLSRSVVFYPLRTDYQFETNCSRKKPSGDERQFYLVSV